MVSRAGGTRKCPFRPDTESARIGRRPARLSCGFLDIARNCPDHCLLADVAKILAQKSGDVIRISGDATVFEAVKAMAAAARDENEILKARIAALEAKVAGPVASAAGTKRGGPKKATPEA